YMKTRHTRLFASVSAAALIGITALTPMAAAQEDNGPLDPWNLNYYTQQVIDQLNSLGYSGPLDDVDDILAAVENIRNDANGGQDEMVKFLNLLAEYIQKPSYNPPAGPVYNEQGQLRDRYTFYYGDVGDNVSPEERYGWEDGTGPALDDEGNITDDRYTAGENSAYLDTANNDSPVNANGTPIQRENEDGSGAWVTVDTDSMQFDRVAGEWVTNDVVTDYTDEYAKFDSTPRFLDSLNGDIIVGEVGLPIDGVWNVPNGDPVTPPGDGGDGSTSGGDDETPRDNGTPGDDGEAPSDEDETPRDDDETPSDGDEPPSDDDETPRDDDETPSDDEASDNPFDGLNVTIEDGRIEVSFPVDLAGNPHTLTASLDAKNGFTVTLTPGGGSS